MKKLVIVVMLMIISITSIAQFRAFEGRVLYLKQYGSWQNGSMTSSIYVTSNSQNHNERIIYQNGRFSWLGSLNGDRYYNYNYTAGKDQYLNLYNADGSLHNWFYIVEYDDKRLIIADGENLYRIFSFTPPNSGQSNFRTFEGKVLYLKQYGGWQNGRMTSSIQVKPNSQNHNERIIYQNGRLSWLGSLSGDEYFNYSYDGQYLNMYNSNGNLHNWFHIIEYNDTQVIFADSRNLYRIFSFVPVNNNQPNVVSNNNQSSYQYILEFDSYYDNDRKQHVYKPIKISIDFTNQKFVIEFNGNVYTKSVASIGHKAYMYPCYFSNNQNEYFAVNDVAGICQLRINNLQIGLWKDNDEQMNSKLKQIANKIKQIYDSL